MTQLEQLQEIITEFKGQDGALIPVLQKTQAALGWLSPESLQMISKELGVPMSKVYGVVTFYSQFYLKPRGRHIIKSCQGTACHVKGSSNVLQALENQLSVKAGETTEDMKFTLETVACLGTCFLAPVVMIDEDYYGDVQPKEAGKILKGYE